MIAFHETPRPAPLSRLRVRIAVVRTVLEELERSLVEADLGFETSLRQQLADELVLLARALQTNEDRT